MIESQQYEYYLPVFDLYLCQSQMSKYYTCIKVQQRLNLPDLFSHQGLIHINFTLAEYFMHPICSVETNMPFLRDKYIYVSEGQTH